MANTSPPTTIQATGYLNAAIDPKQRKNTINNVVRAIKQHIATDPALDFAAIAVSGISGITIGSIVAAKLGKRLIIVRKHDDTSTHSDYHVEGLQFANTRKAVDVVNNDYLILDDLIDSGTTVKYIIGSITMCLKQSTMPVPAKCVGAVLYNDYLSSYANKDINARRFVVRHFVDGIGDTIRTRLRAWLDRNGLDLNIDQSYPSSIRTWL